MKSLLLKDAYLFVKQCRQYIVVILIFLVVSAVGKESNFMMTYPTLVMSLLPMTLLAYEEKDKWQAFAQCLPYSAKTIVLEKYLAGFITGSGMVLVSTMVQSIWGPYAGMQNAVLLLLASLFLVNLLAPAIMLPFLFKLGVEKGRIAYYIIIGAMGALASIATEKGTSGTFIALSPVTVLLVLAAVAGTYILSILLSIRFYQARSKV